MLPTHTLVLHMIKYQISKEQSTLHEFRKTKYKQRTLVNLLAQKTKWDVSRFYLTQMDTVFINIKIL